MLRNIFVKFVLLTSLLGEPSAAAPQDGDNLLWIDFKDATVRLVDLNDQVSEVCELPKYPAPKGPATLAFYDPTDEVVACGEFQNIANQECYSFDGLTWQPLPPLHEDHRPVPYFTRSYYMEGGLWVGGQNGSGGMLNEILNSDGQWITLPVYSPYDNYYYLSPCSVPLNKTHIFFSEEYFNGDFLIDTWILNLDSLEWTSSTPMLTPRRDHGCVLTEDGEVLIAGGGGSGSSVHIFNPVTLEWRESGDLPSETLYPGLLLWKDKVILMEHGTTRIWEMEEDQGWRLMDVTMGASFNGYSDNAVLVPDSWRAGCA